jgi:Arc/MetJ family transcription regulator
MSKTLIDIDDEALAAAARILGTTTKRDTVNTALRRLADNDRRVAAIKRMRELVAEGALNMEVFGLPEAYGPPQDSR